MAAGFSVFPSLVRGVFASRECVNPPVEKSAAGDASRYVTGRGWMKGMLRPNATRSGRARLKNGFEVGLGRIAVRRSILT